MQIGVAGRTGCGKSTLMMALFRIVEPCGGRILIDGLNVSRMGLTDLRSRLALVPQVSTPDSVHPSIMKFITIIYVTIKIIIICCYKFISGGPYSNHPCGGGWLRSSFS